MSLCMLRALKKKMPTRSLLKRLNITDLDSCVLCNQNSETVEHLFFECPFSAYLWKLCKLKLGFKEEALGTLEEKADKSYTNF